VKVPLEQVVRAHTINVAYMMGMDDQIGSLEVVKPADLIVLEKNLFDMPPEEIHKVNVLYSMMNGKLVHEANTLRFLQFLNVEFDSHRSLQ